MKLSSVAFRPGGKYPLFGRNHLAKQCAEEGARLQRVQVWPESQHGYRFQEPWRQALALNPRPAFASPLQQTPKCCHNRNHGLCASISSGLRLAAENVACSEWPNIRSFEHFLQLLDVVNDTFNVHSVSISDMSASIRQTERHLHFEPARADLQRGTTSCAFARNWYYLPQLRQPANQLGSDIG